MSYPTRMNDSAQDAFAITPSDDDDLPHRTRAVYVGTGGNVKVKLRGGGIVTYTNVASGSRQPWQAVRIYDTDTTASGLIGEF